jgi:hypothetical protein
MTKFFKYIFVASFLFGMSACSDQLEKQLTDPNNVDGKKLDINFLTNSLMFGFTEFFQSATAPTMDLSRVMAFTGGPTYALGYQPQGFDGLWADGYQGVIVEANTLLGALKDDSGKEKGLFHHEGVAKTLKAYTLITLVDLFNDVPNTNAARASEGDSQFNPTSDKAEAIYVDAIKLLDEAVVALGKVPVQKLTRDIYYGGDEKKWAALARTIKLKALMNRSLINAEDKNSIATLLTQDLVDTEAEAFFYKYGSAIAPASSRSAYYRQYYTPTAGTGGGYISNYFMLNLYQGKTVEDPRWRYYFYRQVGSISKALETEPKAVDCIGTPRPGHITAKQSWCLFDPGFLGRDHGNDDGINPDGKAITCVGVYPFGGRVDLNNGNPNYEVLARDGQGANGAGIEPIWMHWFTNFVKAEAYERLKISGNAKTELLAGVTASINYVKAFGAAKGQAVPANLVTPTADYISDVEGLFDAPNSDKLGVIGKEYWISLYGNGVEAYNLYRRTGKPGDMQPMRNPNSGNFIYSFIYPANYVNLNKNAVQKSNSSVNRVFWDNTNSNLK